MYTWKNIGAKKMRKHWPDFVDASYGINMRGNFMTEFLEDLKAALNHAKLAEGHLHETGAYECEKLDKAYEHLRDARVMIERLLKNG